MAKVNSDELHDYVEGTIGPVRAREIERQAESDEELAASIWLLRRLYDSDDDIQSLQSEGRDVPSPDGVPQLVGRYELTRLYGQGSMAEVWLASDPCLCRAVAIKILRAEYCGEAEMVRRFCREMLIAGQLQHPGILPVYEAGRLPDHRPFFAMKLVRGHTLAELLATRTSPRDDLQPFVALFKHVCEAVAYAHNKGIIHRDLKPSNVMVGEFGEVQVMDWGLAKVLGGNSEEATIGPSKLEEMDTDVRAAQCAATSASSQVGVAIGTWEFMPPEQARGLAGQADERSDVFALGACLCAILTGNPPYVSHTKEEVMRQAREADLAGAGARLDACGADTDLIKLAKRCLAAKPDDRPRDASKVATAVAEYIADVEERAQNAKVAQAVAEEEAERLAEEKAEAERRARQLAEKARRRTLWGAASAGLFLLALSTAGIFAWRDRDARQQLLADTIGKALTAAMGGDLDAAEQAIAEAERAGASTGQVRMLRGQIALHRGHSQEARQHLEQAVRLLPKSVAAWGMLAAAFADDGDWERYDSAVREMAKLTPSTPEDFLFKGYAEAKLEPARGLQTIKQAFDRRPMMGIALLLRAEVRALVAQDTDPEEAEGAVQDANYAKDLLRDNPAALWVSLNAHLVKAGVHEHRGESKQRSAELELAGKDAKALERFTKLPDILPEAIVYRWLYFREMGKPDEVLEELRLASEKTEHVYVTFCYALTLYRRSKPGDLQKAIDVLENRRHTYNGRLLPFVLAEHDYLNRNDWPARALKAYKEFAASCKDGAAVMDTQSVLCLLGKKGEAVEARKALQSEQPSRFYTLRHEPLLRCLRFNAGELSEDDLVRGAKGSRWDQCLAHYYVAMTKLAEGDRDGAREHFAKVVETRAFIWGPYDMSWVFLDRLKEPPTWPPWIRGGRAK
jgi:tRNA A-37 threonylcarbamoyl transferase component Bud32/tetratricopeptide (TPR) repeat protein